MGYAVYNLGGRWAGYGVPATCDKPDCGASIDRGLAYLCGEDPGSEKGCGLYFCSDHRYDTELHTDDLQPKPDSPEWLWWILNHHSWQQWREENPDDVETYKQETKDFEPGAELLRELEYESAN